MRPGCLAGSAASATTGSTTSLASEGEVVMMMSMMCMIMTMMIITMIVVSKYQSVKVFNLVLKVFFSQVSFAGRVNEQVTISSSSSI